MSETRLFPSENCEGYFGIKRFDRISDKNGTKRIHMLTAAALLELNFEQPSLDYHSLMKLTKILTRDNEKDMREMFRRMCFNVFAHNRDDHSKNFTYLYDDEKDRWSLSRHMILLTVTHTMESILQQLTEMDVIQAEKNS